jgi:signal transduction histidine kinase
MGGRAFIPLAFFTLLELLSCFILSIRWYLTLIPLALIPCPAPVFEKLILFLVTALLYLQNNYVVEPYRNQMFRDTLKEQDLKRDIALKESETKAELQRNMLLAENRILEERASLSQTLHDKLGHNINGSIYQLEAAKLLLNQDPDKSQSMIQAVIDQLRTGMDEIRAILRRERPEKKRLAMVQLYNLCEDCSSKGVKAELQTEGDISLITDRQWEVILDNAFEAVSNSMKYSRCNRIDIKIVAMNKMVRCCISDDGVGCTAITDGMGIAGMRQRMRTAGGVLDFETGANAGFTVNMLIPMGG